MKTLKLLKGIAGKFKNKKGSQTAATIGAIEESRTSDIPEDVEVKGQEEVINVEKAAAQLCEDINENSEDLNTPQPTCETSEKAQDAPTETPSASNDPSLAEIKPCDAVEEKPSIKIAQQRQIILAGFIGTALAASVALCILEMHVVAVACGIVGLVCMGFALYNAINPNTKLEKMEDVKQTLSSFKSNVILKSS